jgi:hypothetical protein
VDVESFEEDGTTASMKMVLVLLFLMKMEYDICRNEQHSANSKTGLWCIHNYAWGDKEVDPAGEYRKLYSLTAHCSYLQINLKWISKIARGADGDEHGA